MSISTTAEWVGRLGLLSSFIIMGVTNLVKLNERTAYVAAKKVPMPGLVVVVAALMMLAGSAMVLARWHAVWGCVLLALYVAPAAFLMHNFWSESDATMRSNQMRHFWKNIQLAGALVLYTVAVHRGAF